MADGEKDVLATDTPDTLPDVPGPDLSRPRTVPQQVPPRLAPGTPPPAVAERLARIAARSTPRALPDDDLPPAPPIRPATMGENAAAPAPPITGKPKTAAEPKALAASLKPAAAGSTSGGFASRRKPSAAPAPSSAPAAKPAAAAAKAVPFGETQTRSGTGKPRFFLLILIAVLLLFMAVVYAWATVFPEGRIAGVFGGAQSPDPITISAPSDSTPLEPLEAPDQSNPDLLLVPTDQSGADAPNVLQPEQLSRIEPNFDAPLDDAITALPDAAPQEEVVQTDPVVTPTTPPGTVLSPAEADRFYAATGVWLRAPRLPLLPEAETLDLASVTAADAVPTDRTAAELPTLGTVIPDVVLATQRNPPSADTVFARDDRGLLLATEAGTLTPYGMLIYAGQPAVVPPTRPGTVAPEPEIAEAPATDPAAPSVEDVAAVAAPEVTDEDAVTATLEALIAEAASPAPVETPVVAEAATPPALDDQGLTIATAEGALSPDGILIFAGAPSVVPPTRPGTTAPAIETGTATAGGVTLAAFRPSARPTSLDIPATAIPLPAYTGQRPVLRPAGLAPAAQPVIDDTTVAATLAAIVASAPDPLATATARAVDRTTTPETRPRNFARVVAAAQARQASLASTQQAAATTSSQPAVVSSAAAQPTGPIPRNVAAAATIESAINLREINLIGVYGRPNNRRALIRLANGQFVRVGVGDSLDGGRVTAISDNVINYVKRGRTIALGVPG